MSKAHKDNSSTLLNVHANSTQPCVLVVYASVGSGHGSAAASVAQALERIRDSQEEGLLPQNTRIELVDILQYGRVEIDGEGTTNLFVGPTRPIYDFLWYHAFTGRINWGGGTAWSFFMFKPFTELVRARQPRAIIATHIVAANCAVAARMITEQTYPISVVPTDYGYEGFWPSRFVDLICAADDLMVTEITSRRVPREKIAVTGIPVVEGFAKKHNKAETLAAYGLPADKLIVLVMAGAKLRLPYVPFRRAIETIYSELKQLDTLFFTFICGSDKVYAQSLREKAHALQLSNVSILEYVTEMPQLMDAADLAIVKSGGLTVTECICAQLPMLLLGTSYGQERANTETVTRGGAGVHVVTPQELFLELQRIDDNHNIVRLMHENSAMMARPHAAHEVAIETLRLQGTIKPQKPEFLRLFIGDKPIRVR